MSPEQMKARVNEIAQEAYRRRAEQTHPGHDIDAPTVVMAVELALSNWTPPAPISPRVKAAREYTKSIQGSAVADAIDAGLWDDKFDVRAFLAGFAAAVKLADELVIAAGLVATGDYKPNALFSRIATYRQSIGDGE